MRGLCLGDPRTVKSGRYASDWNAFSLKIKFADNDNFLLMSLGEISVISPHLRVLNDFILSDYKVRFHKGKYLFCHISEIHSRPTQ